MKQIFYNCRIFFLYIVITFISCKKNQETVTTPGCSNCNKATVEFISLIIPDSSWERQTSVEFICDLNPLLKSLGLSSGEISEMYIVKNQNMQAITPNGKVIFSEGILSSSANSPVSFEGCRFRFVLSAPELHSGESPARGQLPLHLLEIKILMKE